MKVKSVLGLVIIVSVCVGFYVMTASAAQSISGGNIIVSQGYSNDYFLVEREQVHPDDKVVFGSCSYEASRFIDDGNDNDFAILVNGRDYDLKGIISTTSGYPSPNQAPEAYPSSGSTSSIESYNLCFVNETLGITQCGVASFDKGEPAHDFSYPSETSNVQTLPFDDRCLAGVTPINALSPVSNNVLFFPIVMQ